MLRRGHGRVTIFHFRNTCIFNENSWWSKVGKVITHFSSRRVAQMPPLSEVTALLPGIPTIPGRSMAGAGRLGRKVGQAVVEGGEGGGGHPLGRVVRPDRRRDGPTFSGPAVRAPPQCRSAGKPSAESLTRTTPKRCGGAPPTAGTVALGAPPLRAVPGCAHKGRDYPTQHSACPSGWAPVEEDGEGGGGRPLAPPPRRRTPVEGSGGHPLAPEPFRERGLAHRTQGYGPRPAARAGSRSQCQSLSRRSSQRRSWSSMKESQPRFSSRFGVFAWRAGPVPFGRDNA